MNITEAVSKHGGLKAAARALGIPYSTLHGRLAKEKAVTFPKFPSASKPATAIIKDLAAASLLKKERRDAERWFSVKMRTREPIGILWFGDPHLGTSTDWHTLQRDVALCNSSPGMYGANIGDTTNNWVGTLKRLYADEDISNATERKLAKWFLAEAGITWLVWLLGNHDEWEHGSEILRLMDIHNRVPMLDWAARFQIEFPAAKGKGVKSKPVAVKVHAAHDFPGHSMWNIVHGPARAPKTMGSDADLLVCGHKHDWGFAGYEIAERRKTPVAVRVASYKKGDPHARRLGFQEPEHGASMLTIIDPDASPAGRVTVFVDPIQGAKVLKALRGGK